MGALHIALACSVLAAGAPASAASAASKKSSLEKTWGIQPVALRLTAGGSMIDFRYRVVDATKALPLFDKKLKPYLLEPRTGAHFDSPDATKLGPLRSSARNPPVNGRMYFVLFSNGSEPLKKGSKFTVVLGDCKLENLTLD